MKQIATDHIIEPNKNDLEIKIMRLSREVFNSLDTCDSISQSTKEKLINAIESVVCDISKCKH